MDGKMILHEGAGSHVSRVLSISRISSHAQDTAKQCIRLDFVNLFWIFTICSIGGLVIEEIYHLVMFGEFQDRAGLLFGPFSPLYGFGGILLTVLLNGMRDKPVVLVYALCAVSGGALEYLVSWLMQSTFGLLAWDYSGTWLSIDGRTNGYFMILWGILGVCWIKLLLPALVKGIGLVPRKLRTALTVCFALFMACDIVATLVAFDCWYLRAAGQQPTTSTELFCVRYFDDDYMANRFQAMSLFPNDAAR